MDNEGLQWIYGQILKWRAAAGQPTKLDPRELGRILDDLDTSVRMPEGLAGYVVLGCEWLFRICEVGPREREHRLRRVERGLAEVMQGDDAYVVTQALEGELSRKFPRHRELAAVLELRPPLFVHGDMVEVGASERRTPLPPPLPRRRGPIPWPAPWVSGVVIERLLRRRSLEGRGAGMGLASVLLCRPPGELMEEKDYRVRASSMLEGKGEAVELLVEDFEQFYCRLRESVRRPGEWHRVVRARLEVERAQGVFPFNPHCARTIVSSYRTPTARKGPQKPQRRPVRRRSKNQDAYITKAEGSDGDVSDES